MLPDPCLSDTFEPPPHVRPGGSIGRYIVLHCVGAGGMGIVYAAYDPELDRKVALKLVRPRLCSPRDDAEDGEAPYAELAREAHALARVSHPNVVAAYDVGRHGELLTIVMEFVEGVNLRSWLERGPRSPREVLALFSQIGHGLAAAHRAGVVHRDMKPENVLLGADLRPRITDFGLALTSTGIEEPRSSVAGTLPYMAPEQILAGRVDARSDQFAFAVTLYEALVGTRPFAGASPSALLDAIDRGLPARGPRGVAPRVCRALARGLARDPARRFPSMDAMLDELSPRTNRVGWIAIGLAGVLALATAAYGLARERRIAHEAVCNGAGDRLGGVWDPARRRELESGFASVEGAPFADAARRSVEASLDAYAREWGHVRVEVCEATRLRGEQSEARMDERIACLDDRRRQLAFLVDELTKPTSKVIEKSVEAVTGLSPSEECSVRHPLSPSSPRRSAGPDADRARDVVARARAKVDLGEMPTASQELSRDLPSLRELGDMGLVSEAQLLLGIALSWGDDFAKAEQTLLEAAWSAESIGDDASVARAYLRLAQVAGNLMANQTSGERYERQAEATLARLGKPAELEAELDVSHAMRIGRAADYAGARALAQQALDRLAAQQKGDSALAATCWNTLSVAARRQGDDEVARAAITRSIEIRERLLGPMHPLVAHTLTNLGTIQLDEGQYTEALATFGRALTSLEATTGAATADAAMLYNNRGIANAKLSAWADARADFARAAVLGAQVFGDHPSTALYVMNLGDLDRAEKKPRDALAEYAHAADVLRRSKSPDDHTLARILAGRGQAELDSGDRSGARRTLEQALAIFRKGSFDPADRADAELGLSRTLDAQGESPARAYELAVSARAVYAKNPIAHRDELETTSALLAHMGPREAAPRSN